MTLSLNLPNKFDVDGYSETFDSSIPQTILYSVPATRGSYNKLWERTLNYHYLKKHKLPIPSQPFHINTFKSIRPSGEHTMRQTGSPNFSRVTGYMYGSPIGQYCDWNVSVIPGYYPSSAAKTFIESQLSQKQLLKIKDSKVNLAQAFAERAQTARLLSDSATRIAKSFLLLKKGRILEAVNQLGAGAPPRNVLRRFSKNRHLTPYDRAATSWLELQYGWLPLLSDVYGSAELLAEKNNRRRFVTVESFWRADDSAQATRFSGLSNALLITEDAFVKYYAKMSHTFELTNTAAKAIADTGISNPDLLAWELTPFSFVADWFVPVGSYLQTFDSTAGLTFIRGVNSYKYIFRLTSFAVGRGSVTGVNGNWTYTGRSDGYKEIFSVGREILSNFPSAPKPSFKNPFSMTHVANAIALIQLVFKR